MNVKSSADCTALMIASDKGHAAVVGELLRHKGVDVDAEDGNGSTALILTSQHGHTKVVHE